MKLASVTNRLQGLGGAKWELHQRGRDLASAGRDIIELTIGEPDVPVPAELSETAISAITNGRTKYADGRGEHALRNALANHYTAVAGRPVGPEHILCFPGTQTALYAVVAGIAEAGDEVLVGDPMYATYEGVVRASGAEMVSVPLSAEHGFRMQAEDIAARITDNTQAILLTTPHNPSGAILSQSDLEAIGALARKHDFWIITDEVYADLVFDGEELVSGLALEELKDRVVLVSSISKSHAAPGFRSGWCVGPEPFVEALLPLTEAMLFGNQPFIADMTAKAIREGSSVAPGMRTRFADRAQRLQERLNGTGLRTHSPQAGMFALVDVGATGMTGDTFASQLLEEAGVSVMPGSSFGQSLSNWVRVALTVDDETFDSALDRIVNFCREQSLRREHQTERRPGQNRFAS